MADYWKSIPRKFCDFCKCWITDNKPSVDFHEQGKRHQENVQKKIGELRKKGLKDYEEQKKLDNDFKKMNDAALKAFAKDIERDPSLASALDIVKSSASQKTPTAPPKQPSQLSTAKSRRDSPAFVTPRTAPPKGRTDIHSWLEAKTDDGQIYYFNSETGDSSWEPPTKGYVSLARQLKSSKELNSTAIGPSAKPDPYGQWVAIDTSDPEPVDLDLPKANLPEFKVVKKEKRELEFKEKTVSSLTSGQEVENIGGDSVFKKRKFNKDSKRNLRRKEDDE